MALLWPQGSKQMCNSLDAFQAYATDETQSVGSSTGVMTPSFTILSNSALTLGHMEIGHFWDMYDRLDIVTYPNSVLTRGLAYTLEPIWELSDEVHCRLDWSCFLGCCWYWSGTRQVGSVLDDLDSTVHFDNFQSLTWLEPQDYRTSGVCHIPTGVYLVGLCTGGTRLPDDGPMKWSKEGYSGTIVGSEPSVAHIEASWVTCLVNVIRIEVSEAMQL